MRRIGGLRLALTSRGSAETLACHTPARAMHIFNAETNMATQLQRSGFFPIITPATVVEWHIDEETSRLRAGLRKKWRNQLTQATDANLKVKISNLPPDPNHWLLKAELSQSRMRRYRTFPQWITTGWATLHPKDTLLLEAQSGGETIAGMIFLRHGKAATYHIAYGNGLARERNAHKLMLWQAALHLRDRGVSRLDLGTIDTEKAPGLARFKLGTGASARRLGGTWLSVPGLAKTLPYFSLHSPFGQKT